MIANKPDSDAPVGSDRPFQGVLVVLLLLLVVFCSCSRAPIQQATYQPYEDPDPERGAENQLRLLLGKVSARENEVAALVRSGGSSFTPSVRSQAVAQREQFYQLREFASALRTAESAIQEKMTALATERAALTSSTVSNLISFSNSVALNTNLPPDERAEEMHLQSRLIDLQNLAEELAITAPPDSEVASRVREKAADVRTATYSPETYVASLSPAIDLLERKLEGLDAEAAVYEKLLGLVPVTRRSRGN